MNWWLFLQVSGDQNAQILVWNPDTMALLHTFKGHKGAVTVSLFCQDLSNIKVLLLFPCLHRKITFLLGVIEESCPIVGEDNYNW